MINFRFSVELNEQYWIEKVYLIKKNGFSKFFANSQGKLIKKIISHHEQRKAYSKYYCQTIDMLIVRIGLEMHQQYHIENWYLQKKPFLQIFSSKKTQISLQRDKIT